MGNELRGRLEQQLAELLDVERPRLLGLLATVDGKDPADQADRSVRELELATLDGRIDRLRERIDALDDASRQAGAGLAPGSRLVLDFGDGPQTYVFADVALDDEMDVITVRSPLGQALSTAAPGQQVGYRTPRGPSQVTLVSVG